MIEEERRYPYLSSLSFAHYTLSSSPDLTIAVTIAVVVAIARAVPPPATTDGLLGSAARVDVDTFIASNKKTPSTDNR